MWVRVSVCVCCACMCVWHVCNVQVAHVLSGLCADCFQQVWRAIAHVGWPVICIESFLSILYVSREISFAMRLLSIIYVSRVISYMYPGWWVSPSRLQQLRIRPSHSRRGYTSKPPSMGNKAWRYLPPSPRHWHTHTHRAEALPPWHFFISRHHSSSLIASITIAHRPSSVVTAKHH